MPMPSPARTIRLGLTLALVFATAAGAREIAVGATIDTELNLLLNLVGNGDQGLASLRTERLEKTLEFLAGAKEPGALYYAGERDGAPSAFLQRDLRRSMADVLRLTYDTELPAVVTSPSTVRTARWRRTTSGMGRLPPFWEYAHPGDKPLVASGVEHLVNTPDTHTGAYYEYDLDRAFVLTDWRRRRLFISLSAQRGPSVVGKQGIIVGNDDHWTYLYSGVSGLNRPGFGWVDSYLYDSYSVAFYLGPSATSEPTRFGIFKWIKAGWVGINMARKTHIAEGLTRYADAFGSVLESPQTRNVENVVQLFRTIGDLPESHLRRLTQRYLDALQKALQKAPATAGGAEAAALLRDDGYLRSVGTDAMISIASLERLKAMLGKPHYVKLPSGLSPD